MTLARADRIDAMSSPKAQAKSMIEGLPEDASLAAPRTFHPAEAEPFI
jgi:hypothetical protein